MKALIKHNAYVPIMETAPQVQSIWLVDDVLVKTKFVDGSVYYTDHGITIAPKHYLDAITKYLEDRKGA